MMTEEKSEFGKLVINFIAEGEHPDDALTLAEINEIVATEIEAMCRLTAIVYLRRECHDCCLGVIQRMWDNCNPELGYDREKMREDFPQYMREVVIWVCERAEEFMKKPCSQQALTAER